MTPALVAGVALSNAGIAEIDLVAEGDYTITVIHANHLDLRIAAPVPLSH